MLREYVRPGLCMNMCLVLVFGLLFEHRRHQTVVSIQDGRHAQTDTDTDTDIDTNIDALTVIEGMRWPQTCRIISTSLMLDQRF
jgi:hypothetical protein